MTPITWVVDCLLRSRLGSPGCLAAFASIALAVAGVRARDGRSLISGGAFGAMTLLLVIHGLSTPGVFLGPDGLISLAGGSALPVGEAWGVWRALALLRSEAGVAFDARCVEALERIVGSAGEPELRLA